MPVNLGSGDLFDGRALFFENVGAFGTRAAWARGALPNADYHHVALHFHAERGANVDPFLDVPATLRAQFGQVTGRYRAEFYYDFNARSIVALRDGIPDPTLTTSTAGWPASASSTMRIANQIGMPGNSLNAFRVDNVLLQGDVVHGCTGANDVRVAEPAARAHGSRASPTTRLALTSR